jgi:carnitine O-acetyltransferase
LHKNQFNHGATTASSNLPAPKRLDFVLNDQLNQAKRRAEIVFRNLVDLQELKVLAYEGYGKNFIKQFKLSPDAYAQMAIQLAYYKCFGAPRATYESSTTRGYAYGRTEVTRSVSEESVAWVKAMVDPFVPVNDRNLTGEVTGPNALD